MDKSDTLDLSDLAAPPTPEPIPTLEAMVHESAPQSAPQSAPELTCPFNLLIEGTLTPQEKEKLLDLISRNDLGIRELDLEPQWESGRIFLPRMSEYACVLIVQALRTSRANLKMMPADLPNSDTPTATHFELTPQLPQAYLETQLPFSEGDPHAVSISADSALPDGGRYTVVDVVTASAVLKSQAVEADQSPEYQQALDALKRELQYKAYHKRATALLNFTVQLSPLSQPTHFRLTAIASAIKHVTK